MTGERDGELERGEPLNCDGVEVSDDDSRRAVDGFGHLQFRRELHQLSVDESSDDLLSLRRPAAASRLQVGIERVELDAGVLQRVRVESAAGRDNSESRLVDGIPAELNSFGVVAGQAEFSNLLDVLKERKKQEVRMERAAGGFQDPHRCQERRN